MVHTRVLVPLLPLVATMLLLETAVRASWVSAFLLPSPSMIFSALTVDAADLWLGAGQTALGALLGFAATIGTGLGVGFILSASPLARLAFYPYAVFFQTVPIIAIAPLLVIWFGYGMPTVVASAFIVSVFPMIANTLAGLLSTERDLEDLFKLYKASFRDRFFKLKLPYALPHILTGLKVSGGLAIIGAIVGEFVGGGGLGGVIDEARTLQRIDRVFAAVLLAAGLGLIFFMVIAGLSRILLRHWHASEQQND